MDSVTLDELAVVVGGELYGQPEEKIQTVSIDSRRIGNRAVFFALSGKQTDGHRFVMDAFDNGAVAAVVSMHCRNSISGIEEKPLIFVEDTLSALQRFAAWWRGKLSGRLLAVTGSNGKTILKDTLVKALKYTCLSIGSQGSFNSQLGVPLSVIRLPEKVDVAVIEAGISEPGEMTALQSILKPDYGILTNIGMAHIAAFGTQEAIAKEKFKLFREIPPNGWLLIPYDCPYAEELTADLHCRVLFYGKENQELPYIYKRTNAEEGTKLGFRFPSGDTHTIEVRTFSDEVILDIEAAVCAAYLLGAKDDDIADALQRHEPLHTRMEIWHSPAGITLINDSCSDDPISVQAALRTLNHTKVKGDRGVFVFGGMQELGELEQREHYQIGEIAARHGIELLVLVGGKELDSTEKAYKNINPGGQILRYQNTDKLARDLRLNLRDNDKVLFKGPRSAGIDKVAREVVDGMAYNRLTVDVQALSENVSRFRRLVGPGCKILGMVKALAYGSNLVSLSREIQELGLDVLGVSTADEGIALRSDGVDLPILVMLCTQEEVSKVVQHYLTPVIYSFDLAAPLAKAASDGGQVLDVHLKVDTGMGRLGVTTEEIVDLAKLVMSEPNLRITGLMTHFACAEDPSKDDFTNQQIDKFKKAISDLRGLGLTDLTCHAAATSSAVRFPEARFDMVRIGLGLYGLYPGPAVNDEIKLDLAVKLLSRVTKINEYKKGDKIGYGGTFTVPYDNFKTGVIPMGYNDGLPLQLSNKGYVLVNGQRADIIGRISMDSAMIDLNSVQDARIGSDVLIFGSHNGHTLRPETVAELSDTIVYEILIRLGSRVQRIFIGK